jgi:hypothetical protein
MYCMYLNAETLTHSCSPALDQSVVCCRAEQVLNFLHSYHVDKLSFKPLTTPRNPYQQSPIAHSTKPIHHASSRKIRWRKPAISSNCCSPKTSTDKTCYYRRVPSSKDEPSWTSCCTSCAATARLGWSGSFWSNGKHSCVSTQLPTSDVGGQD